MGKKRRGQPIDLSALGSGSFAVLEGDEGGDERGFSDAEGIKSVKSITGSPRKAEVLDMAVVASALSVHPLYPLLYIGRAECVG